jgi:anaerobic magnesium-protoporphyrin IX monomethyl ester cyclase
MDILLVNAPVNLLIPHASLSLPLGLAYIGAVLLESGYSVSALDLNKSKSALEVYKKSIQADTPQIIGISALTETYLNSLKMARIAKKINAEIKIVIGGPHASVLYKEIAQEDDVDIVAIGEGELTMLDIANCVIGRKGNLADINGIAYKKNGLVRVTEKRGYIPDIDLLPFPDRHLFPINSYQYPFSFLTSRGGCPFACRFCAVNNIWEGNRRFRKPEKVADEVFKVLANQPLGMPINFSDDTFTLNREGVLKLCKIFKNSSGCLPLLWRCSTRVDLVDAELLREMRFAGCNSIQYGIEAGSQKILDSIGKKIRLEQVKQAVRMTLEYGLEVTCSFMFPQPNDTEETIKEQIRLMEELRDMGATLTLALTTPYPGTYYYEHAEELGMQITANNWDEYDCQHLIITTKNLPRQRLEELLNEMITALDIEKTP